jgi:hypothetical protein
MSVASLGLVKNGFDNPLVSIAPQDVIAGGPVQAQESVRISQGFATQDGTQNPTAPTFYQFDTAAASGGGLNAHSLQLFGYFDARVSGVNTIQEFMECRIVPTAAPVLGIPPSTTALFQTTLSKPLNWGAPLVGGFTGTGAAQVINVAGITAGAVVRLFLQGGTPAAFTAGIAPPTLPTIQPYVSFTTTATAGADYGYEVLNG